MRSDGEPISNLLNHDFSRLDNCLHRIALLETHRISARAGDYAFHDVIAYLYCDVCHDTIFLNIFNRASQLVSCGESHGGIVSMWKNACNGRNSTPMRSEGRYSRQELFAPIGPKGQEHIRAARVLIAGCGGLGSNSADLLARAGVGFLRIVDRDLVELSNLQRQFLFNECDAHDSAPKSVAAAKHIATINSDVKVEPVVADIGSDNISDLLQGIDLAIDGFDNLEARYLLNDACVKQNVPWIYGCCVSATVMAGLILPGKTARFRCLHRDLPEPGSVRTCDMAGVIGPAALIDIDSDIHRFSVPE
jgi:molybdopterin/thiamine biosynthesis adenylyltransferase